MKRLALDIDSIAYVRNLMRSKEPDPVSCSIMAELGGAESVVCYLRDDHGTVKERDVRLLKELIKTHLTVRTNLNEENIRKLIAFKIDMITFVAPGDLKTIEPVPLSLDTYASQLQTYIAELRSNNILSSVLIDPTIAEVKEAAKLEFDYIEFDATSLTKSQDMESEYEILDNIAGLSLAANKLGMGINISGGIGYDNIKDVSTIDFIEDIVVGKPVFSKAMFIGVEQAVRDMQALLGI
jgi:pyridoxine 5-phosphate synthase